MEGLLNKQADLQTPAAILTETTAGKWEQATGNLDNALAKIGSILAPAVNKFAEWLGTAANAVQEWIDENPRLADAIVGTFGGLAVALSVLGGGALAVGGQPFGDGEHPLTHRHGGVMALTRCASSAPRSADHHECHARRRGRGGARWGYRVA